MSVAGDVAERLERRIVPNKGPLRRAVTKVEHRVPRLRQRKPMVRRAAERVEERLAPVRRRAAERLSDAAPTARRPRARAERVRTAVAAVPAAAGEAAGRLTAGGQETAEQAGAWFHDHREVVEGWAVRGACALIGFLLGVLVSRWWAHRRPPEVDREGLAQAPRGEEEPEGTARVAPPTRLSEVSDLPGRGRETSPAGGR